MASESGGRLRCLEPSIGAKTIDNDVLTLAEAAELLRCHPVTVKRLAIKGEVPAKKVGSLWRFSRQRLMGWIQQSN